MKFNKSSQTLYLREKHSYCTLKMAVDGGIDVSIKEKVTGENILSYNIYIYIRKKCFSLIQSLRLSVFLFFLHGKLMAKDLYIQDSIKEVD